MLTNSSCSDSWHFIFEVYIKNFVWGAEKSITSPLYCRPLDKFTTGLFIQGEFNNKSASFNSNIKVLMPFLSYPRSMLWHRILCHILVPAHWAIIQFVQQPEWITLSAFRVRVRSRITYGSFSIQPSCTKWFKLESEGKIRGLNGSNDEVSSAFLRLSFSTCAQGNWLEYSGPGMRRNT